MSKSVTGWIFYDPASFGLLQFASEFLFWMNLEMDPQAQTKLIQIQTDENGRPLNPQKVSSFRRYLPQVRIFPNNNFQTFSIILQERKFKLCFSGFCYDG